MGKLEMCRICLAEDVRMYNVDNKDLHLLYEMLTNFPFVTEDSRPMLACVFCYTKLKRCYQFQRKCLEAEKLFTQMLNEDDETKPVIKQGSVETASGLMISPQVHIHIIDACEEETNSFEEFPVECEKHSDVADIKEEYDAEFEPEYRYEEYVNSSPDVEDMSTNNPESDSEDDIPLMEFKTEVEEEEVSKKIARVKKTRSAPDAKKPELYVRLTRLEDTIMVQQKKTEQPDSQFIRNTQKRTSTAGPKFKKNFKNSITSVNSTSIAKNRPNEVTGKKRTKVVENNSKKIRKDIFMSEKPYKCDICPTRKRHKRSLMNHIRKEHGPPVCYQCDSCSRKYTNRETFIRHLRTHNGEKPFKCDSCQKSFNRSAHYRQHIINKHSGEKPYQCDLCQRGFATKYYLIDHIRFHIGKKLFQCDVCGIRFGIKVQLKQHLLKHTREKPYKCEQGFNLKKRLITHMQQHTDVFDTDFQCEKCGKHFTTSSKFKAHLRLTTCSGYYRLPCHICQHGFNSRCNLERHMRTHTGEKPYTCDICQRSFNERCNLERHMRTHTGEKPHTCDICQRSFNERNKLNNHKRVHSGEKPFKCHLCPDSFSVNSSLSRHIFLHSGKKPYKCDVCQRAFSFTSDLNRHIQTHNKVRPFLCELCPKSFTQSSSLNVHIRKTHDKRNRKVRKD